MQAKTSLKNQRNRKKNDRKSRNETNIKYKLENSTF